MHAVRWFFVLLLAVAAGEALAWGEEGHRMVGAIADRHLSPQAKRQVEALLKNDRLADGQPSHRRTLGDVAYWADEIKDYPKGKARATWHYDDIPVCGLGDYSRICRGGNCASARLADQLEILGDAGEPRHKRNEALKWVVHLAGDIHQPLHAADRHDRGGNSVQVSFFGERDNSPYGSLNLHAIWDVHMVRRLVTERGGEAAIVNAPIAESEAAVWRRGSITDWIDESNQLARSFVYPTLPVKFSCSGRIEGVLALDRDYYSKAALVIETQIRKAGVRLAHLLNTTLR